MASRTLFPRTAALTTLVGSLLASSHVLAQGLEAVTTRLTAFQTFLIGLGLLFVTFAVLFMGWRIMYGDGMRGVWHVPVGAVIIGNAVVIATFIYGGA